MDIKKINAEKMLLQKLKFIDQALKNGSMNKAEREDLRIERMSTLDELELLRA
jgi:hypothetical protein